MRTASVVMVLASLAPSLLLAEAADNIAPFLTPYKYSKLVLEQSPVEGSFDSQAIDDPFVFRAHGAFYMIYIGHDGTGYQTGLAQSDDLVTWNKKGLLLERDPHSKYTRTSIALDGILRDNALNSSAPLKKVGGRYLASWHAYPGAGYEVGPAVIGLAWSRDLKNWELSEPVLRPEEGADWERGGLYKSYLMKDSDTYYLFYNAKNETEWPWVEQTGVATSRDLKNWKRYPGNPIIPNGAAGSADELFASNPFVVRHRKTWALYYFGLSKDGKARELLALGKSPYQFSKVPQIIVDVGAPGSIDAQFAHKTGVIGWRGDLYHFYTAASGKRMGEGHDDRGIAVARSRPWDSPGAGAPRNSPADASAPAPLARIAQRVAFCARLSRPPSNSSNTR